MPGPAETWPFHGRQDCWAEAKCRRSHSRSRLTQAGGPLCGRRLESFPGQAAKLAHLPLAAHEHASLRAVRGCQNGRGRLGPFRRVLGQELVRQIELPAGHASSPISTDIGPYGLGSIDIPNLDKAQESRPGEFHPLILKVVLARNCCRPPGLAEGQTRQGQTHPSPSISSGWC